MCVHLKTKNLDYVLEKLKASRTHSRQNKEAWPMAVQEFEPREAVSPLASHWLHSVLIPDPTQTCSKPVSNWRSWDTSWSPRLPPGLSLRPGSPLTRCAAGSALALRTCRRDGCQEPAWSAQTVGTSPSRGKENSPWAMEVLKEAKAETEGSTDESVCAGRSLGSP